MTSLRSRVGQLERLAAAVFLHYQAGLGSNKMSFMATYSNLHSTKNSSSALYRRDARVLTRWRVAAPLPDA